MKVIGLDVSSTSTGVVVIDGNDKVLVADAWKPKSSLCVIDRAIYMGEQLMSLLEQHEIAHAVVEGYGFSSQSLAPQAETKGILKMVLRRMGVGWRNVAPTQLKKYVGGQQKEDVKLAVFKRWGFEHKSNDVVDAYVLARIAQALVYPGLVELTKPQKEVLAKLSDTDTLCN